MTRRLGALAALALAAAGCGGGDSEPGRPAPPPAQAEDRTTPATPTAPRRAPAGPITEAGVAEHLRALARIAGRNGGNRASGTGGEGQTADLVAERLRAAGWRVRFQTVRFPFFDERSPARLGDRRRGRDFRVLQYSGAGEVRARMRPIDDQACTAAALSPVRRGEIALVARGRCTFRVKARNARRAGAAALVVVDREATGGRPPVAGSLGGPQEGQLPVLAVTAGAGARLARAPAPVALAVDTVSERRATRNVLAETPGTEAGARVLMAGAHLDSVPAGPGINDDGSGIAALLEVAERLAGRPGLRMGFWAAEEVGLYGSRAYVERLSRAERRAIAAYLNLDMVGSPRPRRQVYDTDDAIERVLRRALPGREGETSPGGASDHAPFERAGIPHGGLFTGASRSTDPCYHRACDTLRNVDEEVLVAMARAAQRALEELPR